MPRWVRPEVYPLMAAMTFVTSMCAFQLTRNVFMNPDVRVNKAHRTMGVLENHDEGKNMLNMAFEGFLRTRPPEVMPSVNSFFSDTK